MIVGIGCDLANINRFEKALAKFGGRFVNRAFSEREKAELARRERLSPKEHACAAAKRFAAKEACTKALGTGFRDGIFMRDIEIVHQPSGKPELYLQNTARHPSAIGVAVNVGCWSHRRGHIIFDKDLNYTIDTHSGVTL